MNEQLEWVNERGDLSPGLDLNRRSGLAWRLVGPTIERLSPEAEPWPALGPGLLQAWGGTGLLVPTV